MTRAAQVIVIAGIAWGLWLPLHDVLTYPDRISVLPNLQTDAPAYHAIGLALATTGELDALPPRHPPGWVTMLALLYRVTGPSYVAAKLISWVALIASVAMCWYLARRVFGKTAAALAALLCALSPALRYYVGTVQYEVVTGTGLLAVLVLAVRAVDAPSPAVLNRRAVLAGVAGALLILTRETFVVIVPLAAAWLGHRVAPTAGRHPAIAAALLVVIVSMLPAVAWSAVQSYRFGGLVTISEKGPIVVELGNNPRANGTYNAPLVGIGQPTGLAFVTAYPGRTVVLAGRKILYFWGVLRDGWNVPRASAVWVWRASTGLIPLKVLTALARGGWLLALFVLALVVLGRDGLHNWWALPATVLVLMAVHVAVLSSHRFAVPILPVVFVLISGPLARVVRPAIQSLRSLPVAGAVILFAALFAAMQFQAWPLELRDDAADLDGLEADNVDDAVAHRTVRFADAKRGLRPVVLLPDEYLPAGALTTEVTVRRTAGEATTTPAARIALVELDGHVACSRDIGADEVPSDRFATIAVPCRLSRDTPATLAIFSLGTVDLAFEAVRLRWTGR
jgi:4-amino-4-deoxy-L-arabinose transferase-like glycosyltransferase